MLIDRKMKRNLLRLQLAALIIMAAIVLALGQTAANSTVEERNVRAAMNFLASDAMQGRGSGTAFERITAEYVGSQFMQFGLEPAGDFAGFEGDFVLAVLEGLGDFRHVRMSLE